MSSKFMSSKEQKQPKKVQQKLVKLAFAFKSEPNPSKSVLNKLAKAIDLPIPQVAGWFANRRMLQDAFLDGPGLVEPPISSEMQEFDSSNSNSDDDSSLVVVFPPDGLPSAPISPTDVALRNVIGADSADLDAELTLEDLDDAMDALLNESESEHVQIRNVSTALRETAVEDCATCLSDHSPANREMASLRNSFPSLHLELIQAAIKVHKEYNIDAKRALLCVYMRKVMSTAQSKTTIAA